MKVSVIIPVVRQNRARLCVNYAKINAGIDEKDFEILAVTDYEKIGCPKMVKKLTDLSNGERVCFLGDDCIPKKDYLKNALKVMEKLPEGWGLVGLNDNSKHIFATHWLAHKKLLPFLGGEFFHTGYKHCYCDVELTDRCEEMDRYIFAEDAIILHENPFLYPSVKRDSHYNRAYSSEYLAHDSGLYKARKQAGYK